jgi:hypothetical protein
VVKRGGRGRGEGKYVLASLGAVSYAVDGAWRIVRIGNLGVTICVLPVWPVSFVTRRLGKVITCLVW